MKNVKHTVLDNLMNNGFHEHQLKEMNSIIQATIEATKQALSSVVVNNSSFDDEKFIEALFAEYNKSYKATKEGQVFPQWLDDEQLKWVITAVKNCNLK